MDERERKKALGAFIAEKFFSGQAVPDDESLFMSGSIDSLGIMEIATFISKSFGCRIEPTAIVEEDLDTLALLCQRITLLMKS